MSFAYYQCDKCGRIVGERHSHNLAGSVHECGGRLHSTRAPNYGKETDPVVLGSRYLLGLIAAFLVIVALGIWAALGCPLPSIPRPDQTPTSEPYRP